MIVSIHQPHWLPWMGYLHKVLQSDVFVWLEGVQYRKNYFQNRTKIRDRVRGWRWLTLPVHAPLGRRIDAVTVADPRWHERLRKALEQTYGRAPHAGACVGPLLAALDGKARNLAEIDLQAFEVLLRMLGGERVRVVRSRDLGVAREDPTDRLVDLFLNGARCR